MVNQNEIAKIIEIHLEAIDTQQDAMIKSDYSHDGIHAYRESIRRLRAILFFYMPNIRSSDYKNLESLTKMYFNETSLIREINVFESEYETYMNAESKNKLKDIKLPLLDLLKAQIEAFKGFDFKSVQIHFKPFESKLKSDVCLSDRQCELFNLLIDKDIIWSENEEKTIHTKRMLAKKIKYVHDILFPENVTLKEVNDDLEAFQLIAKHLHDVCVNLRFVGQYQLNDQSLISKLVLDHNQLTEAADKIYMQLCNTLKAYMCNQSNIT